MKIKLSKVYMWAAIILVAPIALYVVTVCIGLFVWLPVENVLWKKRIFAADRQELLMACRTIIADYAKYTNSVDSSFWGLRKDEKGMELWDWHNDQPRDLSPPLSAVIKNLNPTSIIIGTNRVIIQPKRPARTRIVAFSDVIGENPRPGAIMHKMTNGLYFIDLNHGP